jgi:hypothetical protein
MTESALSVSATVTIAVCRICVRQLFRWSSCSATRQFFRKRLAVLGRFNSRTHGKGQLRQRIVGPSLIHISRQTYLAGELLNTPKNMALWIQKPQALEPELPCQIWTYPIRTLGALLPIYTVTTEPPLDSSSRDPTRP